MAWAVLVGTPLLLIAWSYHRKICWIWVISPKVSIAIRRSRTASILSFIVILLLVMLVHRGVLLAHTVAVILGTRAMVRHCFLAFDQGILVMTFVLLVLVKAAFRAIGLTTNTYESSIDFVSSASDTFLRHFFTRITVRWFHRLTPILLIPCTRDLTAITITHVTAFWIMVRLVTLLLLLILVQLLLLDAALLRIRPVIVIFSIHFLLARVDSRKLWRREIRSRLVQPVDLPTTLTHFLYRGLGWVYFTAGVSLIGLPAWLLHNVHVHHFCIILLFVDFFLWNWHWWRSSCKWL